MILTTGAHDTINSFQFSDGLNLKEKVTNLKQNFENLYH